MQEIRVGIIGTGMMGNTHAEAIRRIPGTKIVAICGSRSYEKKQKDGGRAWHTQRICRL